MKKLLLAIIALVVSFTTMYAQERAIAQEALPQKAQTFIATHFANQKVAIATMERDGFGKDYKVILTNGTKIEFDTKGVWSDISCKSSNVVPSEIIPAKIAEYVNTNFPATQIVEIEQGREGIDVKLNNGVELEFNPSGTVIDVDFD